MPLYIVYNCEEGRFYIDSVHDTYDSALYRLDDLSIESHRLIFDIEEYK